MKRDWDCIRAILLGLEGLGDESARLGSNAVAGFDGQTSAYHISLMIDAGLIEGTCITPAGSDDTKFCYAFRMTWAGHELLDAIRSNSIWHSVKSAAREKGLSLTFDIVKALAAHVVTLALK
jgi:hypothetical protein